MSAGSPGRRTVATTTSRRRLAVAAPARLRSSAPSSAAATSRPRVADNLTGRAIVRFLKETVDPLGTLLITDEYRSYGPARRHYQHAVINHSVAYVDGETHTNTIEGFWALLKRAWYGQHHHYSKHWMPLFVAEAAWKYNHRRDKDAFGSFVRDCFA